MANISLVVFRDDRSANGDAVAVVRDSIRSRAGHYPLKEVSVQDQPALAAQYNVMTTPTILFMRDGDIVDRIIGTPTPSLVHSLLDMRTASPRRATSIESRRGRRRDDRSLERTKAS